MSTTRPMIPSVFATINYSPLAFVAAHLRQFQAIWEVLGWKWQNPLFAAARAGKEISGPKHGTLNPAFQVTDEQRELLIDQLGAMELFDGLDLEPGNWGDVIVMGAKYNAMVKQAKSFVARLHKQDSPVERVSFARMYGHFGQRPRSDQDDGTVEQIYNGLTDEVKSHPWVGAQMALMKRPDAYDEWGGAFATEFELGMLALIVAANGEVESIEYEVCQKNEPVLPDVPPRTIESCTLWLKGLGPILAINAPAVERPGKPSRPTSISTSRYWLNHYGVEPGDTVVVSTVRVHGRRMLGDIERTIHSIDPSITVRGWSEPAENPEEFFNHAMGEVANLLLNAVTELLNTVRLASQGPINVTQVRAYLDELYESPDQGTLVEVLEGAMMY